MDIKLTDIFAEDELNRLAVLRSNEPLVQKMYEYLEDNLDAMTFFQAKMRKLAFTLGNDIDIVIDNDKNGEIVADTSKLIGVNDKVFERMMMLIDKSPKLMEALRGFSSKNDKAKSEFPKPIRRQVNG